MSNLMGPLPMLFSQGLTPIVAIRFFAVFVIIFIIFPLHEIAHAYAAKYLGDDTAERMGRLTLNPFAHIDILGAFFMLIAPFGWAKPVPVDPVRCRKVKYRTAVGIISAAGPLANIVLAFAFVIFSKIAYVFIPLSADPNGYISLGMAFVAQLSVFLAVFNLIPIMPLDGAKIAFLFLPERVIAFMERYDQIIRIAFLFVLFFTEILTGIIGFFSNIILFGMDFITGFIR